MSIAVPSMTSACLNLGMELEAAFIAWIVSSKGKSPTRLKSASEAIILIWHPYKLVFGFSFTEAEQPLVLVIVWPENWSFTASGLNKKWAIRTSDKGDGPTCPRCLR
jgi:hypothetical protein